MLDLSKVLFFQCSITFGILVLVDMGNVKRAVLRIEPDQDVAVREGSVGASQPPEPQQESGEGLSEVSASVSDLMAPKKCKT